MKKIRILLYQAFILGLSIIIGSVVFYFFQKNFNKSFSDEVAWATEISVAALNPDHIENAANLLPGDISQSPDYLIIKNQTVGLGNLFLPKGVDAIYVLSKKDDNIYFIAESTPEGEPLYIAPGKKYEKPPQEISNVFTSHTPMSTGVYTDEFGTYLSRFSPIIDSKNGELVGVLGVDVDYTSYQAQFWRMTMIFWAIWLIIYLVLILLFFYFKNLYRLKNESIISEQKLRAIINAVSNGIIVLDSKSQIVSWNNYCKSIFNLSMEKVLGLKITEVIKVNKVRDLTNGQEITDFSFSPDSELVGHVLELKIVNDNKLERYYELSSVATEINGENYLVASFYDVSKRKQEESELQLQKDELEKLNNLMIGRELKMVEMKKEISELEEHIK